MGVGVGGIGVGVGAGALIGVNTVQSPSELNRVPRVSNAQRAVPLTPQEAPPRVLQPHELIGGIDLEETYLVTTPGT